MAKSLRSRRRPRYHMPLVFVVVGIAAAGLIVALYLLMSRKDPVRTFDECMKAGGAILETYPEQCMIDKKMFTNTASSQDIKNSYIGLSEDAALQKAASESEAARVVERDGEGLAVTMDFVPGRLNFSVKEGVVSAVSVEGEDN